MIDFVVFFGNMFDCFNGWFEYDFKEYVIFVFFIIVKKYMDCMYLCIGREM